MFYKKPECIFMTLSKANIKISNCDEIKVNHRNRIVPTCNLHGSSWARTLSDNLPKDSTVSAIFSSPAMVLVSSASASLPETAAK